MMSYKREIWIDYVKAFACVLVALGHLAQSLVHAGIMLDSSFYRYFNNAIYSFHVPLFFICSGYLYQKTRNVISFSSWKENLSEKFVALGVPYVFFSFVTWFIKNVFSNSVNTQADGLFDTLLLRPSSPYWYLYALFFIYLVTPTLSNKKRTIALVVIATGLKLVGIYAGKLPCYAIAYILNNEIWFAIGMLLCKLNFSQRCTKRGWSWIGVGFALLFFVCSIVVFVGDIFDGLSTFFVGIFGCAGTIILFNCCAKRSCAERSSSWLTRYTMPVFLMHTIFAAGFRILLIKLGVSNLLIHLTVGAVASFAGPILATKVMHLMKLDFLIWPMNYTKSLESGRKDHGKKT